MEKRRFQAGLNTLFQYLKETLKKTGEELFTRAGSDGTRESGFNLREV